MFEKISKERLLIIIIIVLAVIFLPQMCHTCSAQDVMPQKIQAMARMQTPTKPVAKMDTIAIDWSQVKNIFQKMSSTGKSIRYYVVYEYKGVEDVTTTGKSVLDYIDICKDANIKPRLALKVKDGKIVSMIKAPSKMKL